MPNHNLAEEAESIHFSMDKYALKQNVLLRVGLNKRHKNKYAC